VTALEWISMEARETLSLKALARGLAGCPFWISTGATSPIGSGTEGEHRSSEGSSWELNQREAVGELGVWTSKS